YKTCGALMARDGSVSWGISGRREYAADTKRACAELNACVRRAKNNSAGRAAPALAADSSSSKSRPKGSAIALKPQPADRSNLQLGLRDVSFDACMKAEQVDRESINKGVVHFFGRRLKALHCRSHDGWRIKLYGFAHLSGNGA